MAWKKVIGAQNASAHQIPFLPKYREFSKSGALLMFDLKISKEIWTKKRGNLGQSTFIKPPPQTAVLWEAKNYLLGNIPENCGT